MTKEEIKRAFRKAFPQLWARAINSGFNDDGAMFVTLDNHQLIYYYYMSDATWTLSTEPKK